jgi:3-hydroxyisobutyrate dehydrogenase
MRSPAGSRLQVRDARVAVIGLGAMGSAMVRRLVSEVRVSAYDPVESQVALASAQGALACSSCAEAAQGSAVVVVAVRTLEEVEAALFEKGGVVDGLETGSVVLLTSTVGRGGAMTIGAELSKRGRQLVDCPVSGGPKRAALGALVAFVGGAEHDVAKCRPVMELLASSITVVGSLPGDGQAMKSVNQLLCGVHIAAAAEALALARGLGLDLDTTLKTLEKGAAASFMLSDRGPRIIEVLDRAEPGVSSRLDIFVKDMAIVLDAARTTGVATPVAAAAEQLYRIGQASGIGSADDSSITSLLL